MLKLNHLFCLAALAAIVSAQVSAQAPDGDPPTRIARLNYVEGNVSMQPAGLQDWTPAEINRPFTTGDAVYTDAGSRAEFHLDSAIIRAGIYTNFAFLTLNDQMTQLSLTEGDLYINLRDLGPLQTFEVDSPNASVTLLRQGVYRFRISSNGTLTFVVVRQGSAEINGGGQAFTLTPGNSAALSGTTELSSDVNMAPPPDDFDVWSQDRDADEARMASVQYLPRSVVGYEDMNGYGDWQQAEGYGPVWYPRGLDSGWAPYHNGHWAWIEPWGWTWVDDAPWGFAPFHYGRWVFLTGRWGWTPGPIVVVANRPPVVRPVYAPALVAWFGGAHFGIGISIGGGAPSLGWVPLGVGEIYTPSYQCSPRYFNSVNVSNTTIVKTVNITNVYNTVYVNKTVYNQTFVNERAPNAVTAMPQTAFAGGRSVAQAGMSMRARDVQNLQQAQASVVAPPVAPTRQALMASRPTSTPVVHPSTQVQARRVVVQRTPAVAPASFAARQPYLQQHAGEAHNFVSMHAQVAPAGAPPQANRVSAVQSAPRVVNAAPPPQPAPRQPAYVAPRAPVAPAAPHAPVAPVAPAAPAEPRNQPAYVAPRAPTAPETPQYHPVAPQPVTPQPHSVPPPPPPPARVNAPPAPRSYPVREHAEPQAPKPAPKPEPKDEKKDKHPEPPKQ